MDDDTTVDPPPADAPRGYQGAQQRAESLARDPEAAESLLARAEDKARRVRNVRRVRGFWSDLTALLRMIRAPIKGEYRDMPWRTLVAALAAVVYFVNPFDVVPDVVPFVGYVDDAAVIAFVLRLVGGDLLRFRAWEDEAAQAAGAEPAPPAPSTD